MLVGTLENNNNKKDARKEELVKESHDQARRCGEEEGWGREGWEGEEVMTWSEE